MPSAMASETRNDKSIALDDYGLDDLSDNPFASPSPPSAAKKRKEAPSGLGIDEEVTVEKRARAPRIKLDGARLLGDKGIPKLRTRARNLKIKGKGHEFSDAARLLSLYQLWLDDLFPKAKFLDALAMVEKAGHKRDMMTARQEWLDEGKLKRNADTDDAADDGPGTENQDDGPTLQPSTPTHAAAVPDDDDLYDATPRAPRIVPTNEDPADDDLDALMNEAEEAGSASARQTRDVRPGEDDLDALMAEAEAHDGGNSKSKPAGQPAEQHDFADEEAAMEGMEEW